jgi:hypothetical protein
MRQNGTKWYLVELKKIFRTLPQKFGKVLNESCLKCNPFCMASTKVPCLQISD